MYNSSNKAKFSFSELSQPRKKKLKKNNCKNANVPIDEWAYLEWTCVDSLISKVNE
jgi:hypothetical protein